MAQTAKSVLIGGGTGFIGSALKNLLNQNGYKVYVISRKPGPGYTMNWDELERNGLPPNVKAVFNVTGQNVFDMTKLWNPGFKQNVVSSRVNTTRLLTKAIENAKVKPEAFISISGVGYYKPDTKIEYDEESPGGDFDFLSRLAADWENASILSEECSKQVRRIIIRSGVVLGQDGGVIKQMYLPFFFGLGGPIGDGNFYFPWINIQDISNLFLHLLNDSKSKGIYNGVAPQIIKNQEFSKALGKAMFRPAFIPMPVFVLNMMFNAERAKIMTEGQKVLPKRTIESGFRFKYPNIDDALKSLFSKK